MANTPEGKVKKIVRQILDARGSELYQFWPVPGGFGDTTLDVLCTFRGRSFAIETKAPGKKPTLKQAQTIEKMEAAMTKVFVISTDDVSDPQIWNMIAWLVNIEQTVPYDPHISPDQVRRATI